MFILMRLILPIQDMGRLNQRSKLSFILLISGAKLSFQSSDKSGESRIPRYVRPVLDHLKGQLNKELEEISPPRGITSDLS